MDQLVGFLLHPPLSEIGKKIGKMLKYTPTFKVLSAPLNIYVMHMSEFVFCQTQISVSHITAYENDFHLRF